MSAKTKTKAAAARTTGQRFRLYPTGDQAEQLAQVIGVCRALYNAALEQRITAYRSHGVTLNSFSQNADLTELLHAEDLEWVGAVASRDSLKIVLRDLDSAYSRFFKGLGGFPKFKRRGVGESFKCTGGTYGFRRVNRKWAEVRVPKIGWVRCRLHQPIRGQMKSATFSRDAVGWHVAITVELTGPAPKRAPAAPIGLDRGVAATVATSDGELFSVPKLPAGQARRRRALELKLARQQKRSNRRRRTVAALGRLRAREARRREACLHELTTKIAREHGVVAIEDLRVQNMTRSARGTVEEPGVNVRAKAGLNRAILEQGWGELRRQLQYKVSWRGGEVVEVDPRHTSQMCSSCGHVAPENRESQAVFECVSCGFFDHADVNAARNILARACHLTVGSGARIVLSARGGLGGSRPEKREADERVLVGNTSTAVDVDNINARPMSVGSVAA